MKKEFVSDNKPDIGALEYGGKVPVYGVRNSVVASMLQGVTSATVKVYPNPVKDEVIVSTPKSVESVRVLNLNSEQIEVDVKYGKDTKLDVRLLSEGVYLIEVRYSDLSIEGFKFIKE